jgi:membrane-bound lytic murein transglycosylase MltF
LLILGGKTIHVVKGSPSIFRIRNLENKIGNTIHIREIDKYESEQLIAMVTHGNIDHTVCDEHIAYAWIDSLPNLDIHTDVSFTQFYSWE